MTAMIRNLNDFLSEVDEEYSLELFASFNIHRPETIALITSALFKYDLRGEVEIGSAKTMSDHPKEFPYLDMAAVYSVKASLGLSPEIGALLQEISVVLKKSQDAFAAKIDGGEIEHAKRGEYETDFGRVSASEPAASTKLSWPIADKKDDAQKLVGQSKVTTLLTKLAAVSKDRKKEVDDRTKAVMTHLGLKDILGESKKKGYYAVVVSEGKPIISGPFNVRPDGPLIDNKAKFDAFLKG